MDDNAAVIGILLIAMASVNFFLWISRQPDKRTERMENAVYRQIFEEPQQTWGYRYTQTKMIITTDTPTKNKLDVADPQAAPQHWMLTDDGEILEVIDNK